MSSSMPSSKPCPTPYPTVHPVAPRWSDLPVVDSHARLAEFGTPAPAARDKVLTRLLPLHREWIAASPLVIIGSIGVAGGPSCAAQLDVSPKGDPAGFVRVVDETTLLVPERAGNHRMDTFHNVIDDPRVGLLLLVPGRPDTLRINGIARVVADQGKARPLFDAMVVKGHRPRLALLVEVREVFYHCPKALLRARAWDPATWHPDSVPSYADAAKQLWRANEDPAAVDAAYEPARYATGLYPS